MTAFSPGECDGKRALIELRVGRRWHHMIIAILKKEESGIVAKFPAPYAKPGASPWSAKIPEKQWSFLESVQHPDYDFKFRSVLYLTDHQSEDSGDWVRPPTFVTQQDIDAAKEENA